MRSSLGYLGSFTLEMGLGHVGRIWDRIRICIGGPKLRSSDPGLGSGRPVSEGRPPAVEPAKEPAGPRQRPVLTLGKAGETGANAMRMPFCPRHSLTAVEVNSSQRVDVCTVPLGPGSLSGWTESGLSRDGGAKGEGLERRHRYPSPRGL